MGIFSKKRSIKQQEDELNAIVGKAIDNWTSAVHGMAITTIKEEIAVLDELKDTKFHKVYIEGMIDMAYKLQAIALNERAAYRDIVDKK